MLSTWLHVRQPFVIPAPSRRAAACKKGVCGGEVEAEPGADSDRVGSYNGWWLVVARGFCLKKDIK
jgi:hypothetical protein